MLVYHVASCKESQRKLPPKELGDTEKAAEGAEHGKELVFKKQGDGKAAAEEKHTAGGIWANGQKPAQASSVLPRTHLPISTACSVIYSTCNSSFIMVS